MISKFCVQVFVRPSVCQSFVSCNSGLISQEPIAALQFLHEFLLMSVRVQQLKKDWCCRYLNLPRVSESKQYHIVELAYLQQVTEPALNLLSHVIRAKGKLRVLISGLLLVDIADLFFRLISI